MNQKHFLEQLERGLQDLPRGEIEDILSDYTEYFRDALSDGRSEAQIAAALGDPRRLARELKVQMRYRTWERERNFSSLFRTIGAIAGLGALNFILAIPFMVYLCVLTCFLVSSAMISIAGLLLVLIWVTHITTGWPELRGVDLTSNDGYVKVVAWQPPAPDNDNPAHSKVAIEAAEKHRKEVGSAATALHYHMDDVEIDLHENDRVTLVDTKNQSVTLTAQGGTLVRVGSGVALNLKNGYVLARKDIKGVQILGDDGDQVSIEQDDKTGHIDWSAINHDGIASQIVVPKTPRDAVSFIVGDNFNMNIGNAHEPNQKFNLHIGPKASLAKKLLVAGTVMLLGGVMAFLLLLWVVRITWRISVRFVRWQFGRIQSTRPA